MREDELQDIEDMLDGKAMLSEDEVNEWLRKDTRLLIAQVRTLSREIKSASQTLYNLASGDLTGESAEIARNAATALHRLAK